MIKKADGAKKRPNSKSGRDLDKSQRDLFRVLGGLCRKKTLVASQDPSLLTNAIQEQGVEAVGLSDDSRLENRYSTILVWNLLEYLDPAAGDSRLGDLWETVLPGGRLVVVVPNEDCVSGNETVRRFDRKSLNRALKPLGKVRVVSEQPFLWLTMTVTRPLRGDQGLNRTKRNRHRATARLCRGRVMELGCGEGHLTKAISRVAQSVVGVDISQRRILRAQESYPELSFVCADILQLKDDDASYDTVVLAEVLEHVDKETGNKILETAWRLLQPGGRLIVSVPNEDCVPHRNHVREFDQKSLRRLLRPWGRPRLITEQPYKWLMMTVEKQPR